MIRTRSSERWASFGVVHPASKGAVDSWEMGVFRAHSGMLSNVKTLHSVNSYIFIVFFTLNCALVACSLTFSTFSMKMLCWMWADSTQTLPRGRGGCKMFGGVYLYVCWLVSAKDAYLFCVLYVGYLLFMFATVFLLTKNSSFVSERLWDCVFVCILGTCTCSFPLMSTSHWSVRSPLE